MRVLSARHAAGHRSGLRSLAVQQLPGRVSGRRFGRMDGVPQRIVPSTDTVAAARMLGCLPDEVGYCPRCQGLTCRYGRKAQIICAACRAAETAVTGGSGGLPLRVTRRPARRPDRTPQRLWAPYPRGGARTARDAARRPDPVRCPRRSPRPTRGRRERHPVECEIPTTS